MELDLPASLMISSISPGIQRDNAMITGTTPLPLEAMSPFSPEKSSKKKQALFNLENNQVSPMMISPVPVAFSLMQMTNPEQEEQPQIKRFEEYRNQFKVERKKNPRNLEITLVISPDAIDHILGSKRRDKA
jgi:hypothetical protein